MPEPTPQQAMQTIVDVVDLYDPTKPRLGPEHTLYTLIDTIRLMASQNIRLPDGLQPVSPAILSIQDGLRTALDATIGHLIGGMAPSVIHALNEEIAMHRSMLDADEGNSAAAQWHIGRLEDRKSVMEGLFRRFVTDGKNL